MKEISNFLTVITVQDRVRKIPAIVNFFNESCLLFARHYSNLPTTTSTQYPENYIYNNYCIILLMNDATI